MKDWFLFLAGACAGLAALGDVYLFALGEPSYSSDCIG